MEQPPVTTLWPYEQRFEVLTETSFEEIPDAIWSEVIRLVGGSVIKHGCAPGIKHWVLSTSNLLIFRQRLVLSCCARDGIKDAVRYIVESLEPFLPVYAVLERRLPVGRHRLDWSSIDTAPIDSLPPITACSEAGIMHRWPMTTRVEPPATLAVLMHGLEGMVSLDDARSAVRETFPHLLFCGHTFDDARMSFNAAGSESFLAMRYTPGVYASFEASVSDWASADALLEALVHACRPVSVVPVWHGKVPGFGRPTNDSRVS